ncbi:hypothetical protein TNCV_5033511 [Trichonephila clavipes]|nr:hypothetical protein TNCV_5033511 [Trichonephila clavipes]
MTGTLPPWLDSMVGGGTPERSCVRVHMDPMLQRPVSTSSDSNQAHLLPSTSTISESQPTIPTFNTNDPPYLADQAIVKKSRKRLLPKYNETGTSFLQISKSNIPAKFAAIAVKNVSAQKPPLIPRRKKRPPKTICKDIEIKMTPYKVKKSTPVQVHTCTDEEEEMNHRISTPSREMSKKSYGMVQMVPRHRLVLDSALIR